MKANIKINNVYLYLCIIYYLSAFIIGKLSYIKILSVKKLMFLSFALSDVVSAYLCILSVRCMQSVAAWYVFLYSDW